jgi:GntR family transcriptional regulator/MocR family aminotransferase
MDLQIVLDSQSSVPLHRQLYEEIRQAILSGRLKAGQRVPSTRALASMLDVSRMTVSMAYEYLLGEGYFQTAVGSGTFVSRHLPDELLKTARTPEAKVPGQAQRFGSRRKDAERKLSKYGSHLRDRQWLSYGDEEPEIQFSFGRPEMQEFPMRLWAQLFNEHWKRCNLEALDSPSESRGYRPLRESIAAYLARARAVNCTPDQIIIVNGSQQSIDLVTRVLVDRGDSVGLEEPGYIGAKKTFEAQGAEILPIPVDSGGLMVERLKDARAAQLKFVYVTPSHQFPTGVVLALPRRLELLSWAQRTGAYIIEDDYDSEYRYKGRPIPALAGLDRGESVIYIGTFSKVLFPALRLGYLVVPPSLCEVFARAKWLADMHAPLIEQQMLADFIAQGHFDRHIRRMRAVYERRRKTVVAALLERFKENVKIAGDDAGINVLIRLAGEFDEDTFVAEALKSGVGLPRTRQFYCLDAPRGEFLINYGGIAEEKLEEGIARLAAVYAKVAGGKLTAAGN